MLWGKPEQARNKLSHKFMHMHRKARGFEGGKWEIWGENVKFQIWAGEVWHFEGDNTKFCSKEIGHCARADFCYVIVSRCNWPWLILIAWNKVLQLPYAKWVQEKSVLRMRCQFFTALTGSEPRHLKFCRLWLTSALSCGNQTHSIYRFIQM